MSNWQYWTIGFYLTLRHPIKQLINLGKTEELLSGKWFTDE